MQIYGVGLQGWQDFALGETGLRKAVWGRYDFKACQPQAKASLPRTFSNA